MYEDNSVKNILNIKTIQKVKRLWIFKNIENKNFLQNTSSLLCFWIIFSNHKHNMLTTFPNQLHWLDSIFHTETDFAFYQDRFPEVVKPWLYSVSCSYRGHSGPNMTLTHYHRILNSSGYYSYSRWMNRFLS